MLGVRGGMRTASLSFNGSPVTTMGLEFQIVTAIVTINGQGDTSGALDMWQGCLQNALYLFTREVCDCPLHQIHRRGRMGGSRNNGLSRRLGYGNRVCVS
ncbi:unnamed protein product [Pylaiella littoralis]